MYIHPINPIYIVYFQYSSDIQYSIISYLAVLDDVLEEAGNVVDLGEFLHVVTESRCHGVKEVTVSRCEEIRGPWLTDSVRPLSLCIYCAEFVQLACASSTAAQPPAGCWRDLTTLLLSLYNGSKLHLNLLLKDVKTV